MSRRLRTLLPLLVVAAAVGAALVWLARPEPVSVLVATVSRGPVEDSVANTRAGTVKACRRAGISPATGGPIARLPVAVGDTVETGQLLLELWNEDLKAQLELATAQASEARARARQGCVRADVARREAARLRTLRGKGLATEEAADKADGEAAALKAACEALRAGAQVSQARIAAARANLARTRLTAPFAGIVAEINGEVGEVVTPSPVGIATPPAIDLVDRRCLYVSAPIDEVDVPAIRVDMAARITLDAFPGRRFAARVRRIAPYVQEKEKQARVVDVEAEFTNPADTAHMLPGYSADVEIIVQARKNVLRVPTEAVLEGKRVFRVGDDGRLHQVTIKTGLSNWNYTEVLDGLMAGDRVVLSIDREGVADGAPVRVEQRTGPGA
ncbi:MAG TPA: efflux RND transporter periplasmic adaptor subunit [Gammaproteobacteria bacterium]|nr:efflux RND transporter periplasmic adaptor subunit [Gammaproteobacteria bacterium]